MVRTIRDVHWYLDGHHSTLAKRSCPVPCLFSQFVGYNTPEKSKHRKRCNVSLCSDLLSSHAQQLFGNLQAAFWPMPQTSRTFVSTVEQKFLLGQTKNHITPSVRTVLRSPRSQIQRSVNCLYCFCCVGFMLVL